ncbi:START domain-containing protein 10, partial [Mucuna pruriens]
MWMNFLYFFFSNVLFPFRKPPTLHVHHIFYPWFLLLFWKKRIYLLSRERVIALIIIQHLQEIDTLIPATMSSSPAPCSRSWSISEDSLRRYVQFASESCIQELLAASDTNRGNGNDGWKVLTLDNGVEISKRRSGSLHTFRSRWVLRSVSPQQFITVANAIDAAKQWDSDLVEARYIKDLEENLSIIRLRFGDNSKPLFRNREFIVYERRETMEDGTLVVAVASLPKEIAAGLHPKQSNAIRGLLLQSGWVVEKLEDDSCVVTYVVQLDPAGWLPKCFVNRFNTKLVMIIENLKKLAQACPSEGEI